MTNQIIDFDGVKMLVSPQMNYKTSCKSRYVIALLSIPTTEQISQIYDQRRIDLRDKIKSALV